ncbi:hypothetical protein [Pseudomonas soli]|uniref:hypothetical protein n=1 Tax=Pseudomonas soli TaxID=1306993 RepID=UPI0003C7D094
MEVISFHQEKGSSKLQTGVPALLKRALDDGLSMPVFIAWSLLLSTIIEASGKEQIQTFFVNVFEEGIALKSIIALSIIALLTTGVAIIFCPSPGGKWEHILCSPSRLGRGMSATTLAFMIGTLPVLWFTQEWQTLINLMILPLGCTTLFWIIFSAGDFVIYNASHLREETLFRVFKWALPIIFLVTCSLFYLQIIGGAYAK